MKILLLVPVNINSYQIIPDLGLGYLATALRKDRNSVIFLDCPREKMDIGKFRKYIDENHFDAIGIKVYTGNLVKVKTAISIIKEKSPQTLIIVGGPHPSSDPEGTLKILAQADYGFQGEAEVGFPLLIKYLTNTDNRSLEEIPGLIWRVNGRIKYNTPVFTEDLDSLGFPSWDLLEPQRYPDEASGIFVKSFPAAPLIASRGCPYRCSFCAGPKILGRKIRYRSVENLIAEILFLKEKYDITDFTIIDDNFTGDKSFVMKFCNMLLDKELNITWSCPNGVRLDSLDAEMLKLMEKSGCYSLGIGVESGSDKILRHMGKALTVSKIREKVALIKKSSKIEITGFFIIGYPEESLEDIKRTINFSRELNIDRAHFCIFIPLLGTKIFSALEKEGFLNLDKIDFNTFNIDTVSVATKFVEPKAIKSLHKSAYLKFYLRPRIILELIKKIKSFGQIRVILRRIRKAFF